MMAQGQYSTQSLNYFTSHFKEFDCSIILVMLLLQGYWSLYFFADLPIRFIYPFLKYPVITACFAIPPRLYS